MGLPPNTFLHVLKPLYGISEAGLHWYLTYMTYHVEKLGMKKSKVDPGLLFKREYGRLTGAVGIQVDYSLGFGTADFLDLEEKNSKVFITKPHKLLTESGMDFNGMDISLKHDGLFMSQTSKIDKLTHAQSQKEFDSQRALAQYVAVTTSPELCAPTQLIGSGNQASTTDDLKVAK